MSKQVQQLLDQLAADARASGSGNFDSFEAPANSYEVSAFENYLVSQGFDAFTARKTAQKAASTPAMGAQIKQAMRASNQQGIVAMSNNQQPGNVLAAASFGITVTRVTATIAQPLPFAIFGQQDYQNGYRNVIGGLLPTGVTLSTVRGGEVNGLANQVEFTYTQGANTDIVRVTSDTYPYPSLLESSGTDLLRMSKIRMELSDATQANQFRQEMQSFSNSPFGKGTSNKISPTSFRTPQQFQTGIVDLDLVIDIDKETALYGRILNVTNFSVTFNSFVEKFYRQITMGGI
jgi:hypothetical protein